jgi:hypothetical protein
MIAVALLLALLLAGSAKVFALHSVLDATRGYVWKLTALRVAGDAHCWCLLIDYTSLVVLLAVTILTRVCHCIVCSTAA